MTEKKQEENGERQKPTGRPLTKDRWIELMNSCDRLHLYEKKKEENDDE